MQLSLRLSAIGAMVSEGNRLVDVGCDHGYLPVYLVQTGKIPCAIAMDVGKGPLARAQEHIMQYGLSQYIECRLSDGLDELSPGEGDTLVLAGMGGPLMEKILTRGRRVRDSFQELILQPQSDVPHFRRYLYEEGYAIVEENMVLDANKFYPMMRAVKQTGKDGGQAVLEPLTHEEAAFGRLLLQERHPLLKKYLENELRIRENVLFALDKADKEAGKRRISEVEEERREILNALKKYEGI